MMRIEWDTTTLGTMHAYKDESEVFEFLKALVMLGFTPTAEMLDNDSPKV